MIFSSLEYFTDYCRFPGSKECLNFIYNVDDDFPNGNYKINDDVYIKVMEYLTKENADITESHIREVDIQVLVSGQESIGIYNSTNVKVSREYREVDDCIFYDIVGEENVEIHLKPGFFCVLFKEDIHNPQRMVIKEQKLKKIVIKANEDVFTQKK